MGEHADNVRNQAIRLRLARRPKAKRQMEDAADHIENQEAAIERLRALLDQVATQSTHPDRDGPGCWWCIAEAGQPHEAGCKYAAERAGGEA